MHSASRLCYPILLHVIPLLPDASRIRDMKFFGFKFSVSGLYSPELCRLLEYPSIQLKALIVSEEPGERTCGKLFNLRILRLSAFWAKRLKESLDAGNGKTYNDCGNERKLSMVWFAAKQLLKPWFGRCKSPARN